MSLHRRPLFPFAIAYLAGIVSAVETGVRPALGFGIGAGIVLVGLVVLPKILPRLLLLVLGVVFAIGFVRAAIHQRVPPGDVSGYAEGKLVHLTGVIASDPEPVGERVRFVLRAERIKTYTGDYPVDGRVMVTLYRTDPNWDVAADGSAKRASAPSYGQRVRIHGRLRLPLIALNPAGPSYKDYLARRRIFSILSGRMDKSVVLEPPRHTVAWAAAAFKGALSKRVFRLFPSLHGSLLLGILLGDYSALPIDVQGAFMRTGTMHLLAASGYNCGVIVLLFGWIMRRLTTPRTAMHCLLILLLWGFAIVAGAAPSIVRATVMVTAFLAAYLLWRAPDLVNSVFFAALVITAINPLSLYDVGFQLSFAAVLAIILAMPLLEPGVNKIFPIRSPGGGLSRSGGRAVLKTARYIVLTLMLSVAAALGTAPITAYYFNYISLVGVVANALAALLVVLLTAAGLAAVVLSCGVFGLGQMAALAGTGIAGCMLGIVTGLGKYPWASLSVRSPSAGFIWIYYLLLLGALEYARRRVSHT